MTTSVPTNNKSSDTSMSNSMCESMYVIKRNGESEEVSFDKIIKRIQKYSKDLKINPVELSQQIIGQIYNGVETYKLDELTAEICAAKTTVHPDYAKIASRIIISNHHKNTSPSYSEVVQLLWDNKDVLDNHSPLVNEKLYKMVMTNKEKINATLDYEKDFCYDYFGFKTLERAYLMRINDKIIERPQHLLMRVALSIHKDDLKEALKAYKLMSEGFFTHATPTLFNMGTQREQASSCFLLTIDEDSVDGIYKTISDCAKISKYAGGIGIAIHKIRSKNSKIRGTNGYSNGIVPMLKVFNETARYINQCFTPETIVYTKNGIKKMNEITCDDYLLTKDSSYKKVLGISVNNVNKEILKIRGKYSIEDVNVTPEHEIYVIQGVTVLEDLYNKKIEPKFILAKDLTENDMLGYPIPSFINDVLEYDNDYCRFYGIMLRNGHTYMKPNHSNNDDTNCEYENEIILNINDNDTNDFVYLYLENKNIHYRKYKDISNSQYYIYWTSINTIIKYD